MPAVLEASLQAVVGRHASLRCWRSGMSGLSRPVQVVLPRVAVPWRLIDLSGSMRRPSSGAASEIARARTAWSGSIWRRRR